MGAGRFWAPELVRWAIASSPSTSANARFGRPCIGVATAACVLRALCLRRQGACAFRGVRRSGLRSPTAAARAGWSSRHGHRRRIWRCVHRALRASAQPKLIQPDPAWEGGVKPMALLACISPYGVPLLRVRQLVASPRAPYAEKRRARPQSPRPVRKAPSGCSALDGAWKCRGGTAAHRPRAALDLPPAPPYARD